MSSSRLKRLILRKEVALVTEVLSAIDPALYIQDVDDDTLVDQLANPPAEQPDKLQDGPLSQPSKAAILINGETIGWVMGGNKAATAAKLLSRLAYRELEKRELTQELLSKYKEITLLFRLAEQLGNTIDIDEISQLIMREAEQVLPSEGGMLLLRTTAQTFERVATFGNSYPSHWQGHCELGKGLVGTLIANDKANTIDNILHHPQYSHLISPDEPSCAIVCIPLKQKEQLMGAVILHRTHLRPYRAEDLKLLTTLCTQAASVIGVLSHEKQLQESRQNALIFQLSSQIRNSLDPSEILNTAVQKINTVLQAERCFFLWCQSSSPTQNLTETEEITIALTTVSEAKNTTLPSILGDYSVTGFHSCLAIRDMLQTQKDIQITQIQQQPQHPLYDFLKDQSSEALLAIPVQTRSGQIGLLACTHAKPHQWVAEETELLQAVGNQLVIAIEQAELYEHSCHSRQLAEEKATQLKQALDELQQMQLKLVQTEKMSSLGKMVAGIAHEINNPVNFIYGNVEHLRTGIQDILQLLNQYQQSYPQPSSAIQATAQDIDFLFVKKDMIQILDSMEAGSHRIKEIVVSLQNFSRLDQSGIKRVDLHEGIESALMLLRHRLTMDSQGTQRDKAVDIIKEYDTLPLIGCHPKQLNQVFMSLLSNSFDALENNILNSSPQITITTAIEKDWVTIKFADSGPGIPTAVQAHLFDPFFTTKAVGAGTGLGLSICYQIVVEQHGGKIFCNSQYGHGTEMVVKIPMDIEPTEAGES